jgi:hypothetical protein
LFVVAMLAWYLTCALMLAEMEMAFPFNLLVFDLSHYWPKPSLDLERADVRLSGKFYKLRRVQIGVVSNTLGLVKYQSG